jgi:hypothetical protein
VRIALEPTTHQGNWGGSEAGRGTIDSPVKLVSLTLTAPTGFEGPGTVLMGTVRRNEVTASDVPFGERMNSVTVNVTGPRKAAIITKGEERELKVHLANDGGFPVPLSLSAALRSYDRQTAQWSHGEQVTLEPGEKASVPFNLALPQMGWWSYELTMADGSDSANVKKVEGTVAYIDAVGPRPRTPDDFQFGIGGMGASDDTAAAGVLIGGDWTRGGLNWNEVEKVQGTFDWRKLDEQVARAEQFGYAYQHLLGYGNIWAARPGYVEKYKPKDGWWANTLAPQLEPWRNFVRTAAERYKGRVHYWEIWNEPDLSGFFKGTTDDYIELLRTAHAEIKSADPQAKVWTAGFATVGGHGGHNLNQGLQRRVIAEAQDAFDAIAHHEHGTFRGFQQAIDGELADMMKALRSPKPLAFNETAIDAQRGLEFQARTLVKKITYAKARGGKYYSWFHIYRSNDHEGFGMLNNDFQPRPIYPAFNEVVRQLRNKAYLADAPLGAGRYALQFGDGTDQVIVAWREDDDVADALAAVRLPTGATATRVDTMGNGTPLGTADSSGTAMFAIAEEPAYIVVRGAGKKALPVELVLSPLANVPDDRSDVLQVTAVSLNQLPVMATVGTSGELKDGAVEVPLPDDVDGKPASAVMLNVSVAGAQHALRIPIKRTVTVPLASPDGRRPDFLLQDPEQIVSFFKNDPGTAHRDWKGPADLSARAWLAIEDGALRVRVDVSDDRAHQPFTGNDIWKADSLQIGIQPPGAAGFYEIGVAARPDGAGQGQVVVLNRPSGAPTGDLNKNATVTATSREGGVLYELSLPLAGVGLTDTAIQDGFRFNLIVNDSDNDGAGRDGFIQVAPGIGLFKDAQLFPIVRFR